ncbi:MAG: 50S ribosomal protein L3, partial [Nanoarchaeota archaeon]
IHRPRHGSKQFWPRKRAKRQYARVRTWHYNTRKEVLPLGFAGYKAGMTQIAIEDNYSNSITKGQNIVIPVTMIECPPIKVAGVAFYKQNSYGLYQSSSFMLPQNKDLERKIPLQKKAQKIEDIKIDDVFDIRLLVYTQPQLTVGKKMPEFFELGLGGKVQDKFEYAKQVMGKEIKVQDVLKEGMQVDIHAITKGKGYQGPIKRFGIAIRHHKAEKTKRGPGSLGPWHGRTMERVAHAGQMGYHQRMDLNKQILKIEEQSEKYNTTGGLVKYGFLKNTLIVLRGSIPGPKKRLITMTLSYRPNKYTPNQAPKITFIKTATQQ